MTKIYRNLARNALGKNKIIYVPYIISSMVMVAITYIITSIATDAYLAKVDGGYTLQSIMTIGIPVMYNISFFFLIGVSRFVIKQRKKELGMYCVLGMQKKHIIRVQFIENFLVYLISIVSGTVVGIVLEKVFELLFLRIYGMETDFSWSISLLGVGLNTLVFAIFFFIFFLFNAVGILRSNILDYMKEESKGEKQPKSKWILAILGVILLSCGYYMSFITKDAVYALQLFGLAVILVILGTYALFTAGSITILNTMKKKKKFYYKTGNFISVSGMLYRMKRNAMNLATICIFATMVLVTMSSVLTLYSTVREMAEGYYVVDFDLDYETAESDEVYEARKAKLYEAAEKTGVSIDEIYRYQYINTFAKLENGIVKTAPSYLPTGGVEVFIMTEEIYDQANHTTLGLAPDEVGVYVRSGAEIKDTIAFKALDQEFEEVHEVSPDFKVRILDEQPQVSSGDAITISSGCYYFVVANDDVYNSLRPYVNDRSFEIAEQFAMVMINTSSNRNAQTKMFTELMDNADYYGFWTANSKIACIDEIVGVYGGLFFLGLFLSIAFLTITILNMYFSQLQQGYEDAKRFAIMRKVGLTRKEIKKSINAQIIVVFLLPLLVAMIHTAASYPMVNRILGLLGGCEPEAFMLILLMCVLVFAVFYTVAYLFTRRTYLKMVSGAYDGK